VVQRRLGERRGKKKATLEKKSAQNTFLKGAQNSIEGKRVHLRSLGGKQGSFRARGSITWEEKRRRTPWAVKYREKKVHNPKRGALGKRKSSSEGDFCNAPGTLRNNQDRKKMDHLQRIYEEITIKSKKEETGSGIISVKEKITAREGWPDQKTKRKEGNHTEQK